MEKQLAIGLGLVLALMGAGCLEADESIEPTPGGPPTSPAGAEGGAEGMGGSPNITIISEGGAGGSATGGSAAANATGGSVTLNQSESQEFDLTAISRSTSGATAQAQNVNVRVTATTQPTTVLVFLKERDTGRVVEERTVIVERGNTTNLFVNTTGKDNVVVVTQAVDGTAQVNVAAHGASARIGNETEIDAGGSVNVGGNQTSTSVNNTATGGNVTSVTGVASGDGSRIGDTTNTTVTSATSVTNASGVDAAAGSTSQQAGAGSTQGAATSAT